MYQVLLALVLATVLIVSLDTLSFILHLLFVRPVPESTDTPVPILSLVFIRSKTNYSELPNSSPVDEHSQGSEQFAQVRTVRQGPNSSSGGEQPTGEGRGEG